MKKTIMLLLTLLLFSGCGRQEEIVPETTLPETTAEMTQETQEMTEETTEETTEPTEPETTAPRTTDKKVMADHIPVALTVLNRDDQVEVTGYGEEGYAIVKTAQGEGKVDPQFLRFPDDEINLWTGYAVWHAGVYSDYTCLGETKIKLPTNKKIYVMEELEKSNYVQVEGITGFVRKDQMSKYRYENNRNQVMSPPEEGTLRLLSNTVKTGSARIKIDGVPVITHWCDRDTVLPVLEDAEAPKDFTAILEEDGTTVYVASQWLEREYTPREIYAGYQCKLYRTSDLSGDPASALYVNTPVTVLWDGGNVCFIEMDGNCWFVDAATLTEKPFDTTPIEEETDYEYYQRIKREREQKNKKK